MCADFARSFLFHCCVHPAELYSLKVSSRLFIYLLTKIAAGQGYSSLSFDDKGGEVYSRLLWSSSGVCHFLFAVEPDSFYEFQSCHLQVVYIPFPSHLSSPESSKKSYDLRVLNAWTLGGPCRNRHYHMHFRPNPHSNLAVMSLLSLLFPAHPYVAAVGD